MFRSQGVNNIKEGVLGVLRCSTFQEVEKCHMCTISHSVDAPDLSSSKAVSQNQV